VISINDLIELKKIAGRKRDEIDTTIEGFRLDKNRIEVVDDMMAEVLRRKTPAERISIGFGLWTSARKMLLSHLGSTHPEWDAERLTKEVAKRLSHGVV
jgi:hypothetical protein